MSRFISSLVTVLGLIIAIAIVFCLLIVINLVQPAPTNQEIRLQPVLTSSPIKAQLPPAIETAASVVIEPIQKLTVVQLRSLAKSQGIKNTGKMRKAQLLEMLS
jgi:hypothetical protein